MKQRSQKGTLESKHRYVRSLFVLTLDTIALLAAFFLANFIRFGVPFNIGIGVVYFTNVLLIIVIAYLVIYMLDTIPKNFFQRGYLLEFFAVFKKMTYLLLTVLLLLFVFQVTEAFSRLVIAYTWGLGIALIWLARIAYKKILTTYYGKSKNNRYLIIVTVWGKAKEIIEGLNAQSSVWGYEPKGLVLVDDLPLSSRRIAEINKVPIISNSSGTWDELTKMAVDEVFIDLPYAYDKYLDKFIEDFEDMGLTVNLNIQEYGMALQKRQGELRFFGGFNTISFAKTPYNFHMTVVKRVTDIITACIGLVLTGVLLIFLAPILKGESKGPLIFSQVRVGKNGRQFKLYKFRSMYADAEERKKELMAANEMDDELLFKIENDPRITKVGKFIRRTSIDEFPQFWNVLKGDMSLIGTRPPTLDEYEKYELPYKRRLSIRPGITGLWQVSGRSDITNFEDVLRLDLEYIDHWSPVFDLTIFLKTIVVVLFGKGAK
jgi:exopolysaccharide biosynthesis polyprenyl glycosylphosphotransferase